MKSNLVKIIATFGLIVVIALILKGIFGVGKIGFSKITNSDNSKKIEINKTFKKITEIKKLPTLECTINIWEKKQKITHDLQAIKDSNPKDIPEGLIQRSKYFAKDMQLELFSESKNHYKLQIINNVAGLHKGFLIDIDKITGDLELTSPPYYKYGLTFKEIDDLMSKAKTHYGKCYKIEENKTVSNSSKILPVLKCEIYDTDGSKKIEFYDVEQIKKDDPTEGMTTDQFTKWRSQSNLEAMTFIDSKDSYKLQSRNHENGVIKGYSITIKKNTGELEAIFPKHYPVQANFSEILDATAEGQVFKGECVEVKRKNL